MGSLVPGWDANLGVPRDLVDDTDKQQEPVGYFARLRSHRHSNGGVGEADLGPSIARISAPQSFGRSSTLQTKNAPPSLRSSTMAHSGPHQSGQGLLHQHKYQFTNWSEELATLKGAKKGGLGRASVGSHEGSSPGSGERHSAAWWRALEVGQLNEHPDAVPNGDAALHTSFVPQFVSDHKLDFGDRDKEKGQ